MKYPSLIENDLVHGNKVSVSLLLQDASQMQIPNDIKGRIIKAISANGVNRDFNILKGQPFNEKNLDFILNIVRTVKIVYPNIKISIWTNYSYCDLVVAKDKRIIEILKNINYLFSNQEIIDLDQVNIL